MYIRNDFSIIYNWYLALNNFIDCFVVEKQFNNNNFYVYFQTRITYISVHTWSDFFYFGKLGSVVADISSAVWKF